MGGEGRRGGGDGEGGEGVVEDGAQQDKEEIRVEGKSEKDNIYTLLK